MAAFVARLSGLREIAQRMGKHLGTSNFSSLHDAIGRASTLAFVKSLVEELHPRHTPRAGELVGLDSMAVTLPITQRHRCKKFNRSTAGGGILWEYRLQAQPGSCPVKIIQTMAGAWNDSALMKGVALLARGPIYLMDRGFFSLPLIERWRADGVRFIVRARFNSVYEISQKISRSRDYGKSGRIELDAIVRLGCNAAAAHPVVRLIRAKVGKEHISLVTGEISWRAEEILDAYKKRERIERFHRFVKDQLGLAHLYNFSHTGLMVMLHTALLVAILLFMADEAAGGELETIVVLRAAFNEVRAALGLGHPWKRNTNIHKRAPDARKYKWQELQNL